MSAEVSTGPWQVVAVQNVLGENALWHWEAQCFYWIDIECAALFRLTAASWRSAADAAAGSIQRTRLPERPGSFAIRAAAPDYPLVIAFASGFALFNPNDGAVRYLAKPEADQPGHRFNDGRCDRQGRFWAGTMVEEAVEEAVEEVVKVEGSAATALQSTDKATTGKTVAGHTPLGALYLLQDDGRARRYLQDIRISNALCWSLDSQWLYHADSARHQLCRYPFSAVAPDGMPQLGAAQVLVQFADNTNPDGATVDREGMIWLALWGIGQVVRIAPDGAVVQRLRLPVSQPSSVAIGGSQGDLLFVTTSSLGLTPAQRRAQPQAGDLFICQLDRPLAVAESLCQSRFV